MLFWDIWWVQTSVLLNFYGPVICQNRPDVGNIIPINYQITDWLFHILQHMPCDYKYWYLKKCQLKMYCECDNTQLFITFKWNRYCKPEVISWWKVSITVFYTHFLSPTDQKCAESSVFWQFFYYCPPSIQQERSLKCDAKNSTNIYIDIDIDITLLISDMDFLYQFNLRLHHFWRFFSNVQKKRKKSEVGRSVISWRSG